MIRVDADFSATPFKAKIADAEQLRVHTMLGIRPKDMAAGNVSVRLPPRRSAGGETESAGADGHRGEHWHAAALDFGHGPSVCCFSGRDRSTSGCILLTSLSILAGWFRPAPRISSVIRGLRAKGLY